MCRSAPYKILDSSESPLTARAATTGPSDNDDLTDGVGADFGAGSTNIVIGYDESGNPIISGDRVMVIQVNPPTQAIVAHFSSIIDATWSRWPRAGATTAHLLCVLCG